MAINFGNPQKEIPTEITNNIKIRVFTYRALYKLQVTCLQNVYVDIIEVYTAHNECYCNEFILKGQTHYWTDLLMCGFEGHIVSKRQKQVIEFEFILSGLKTVINEILNMYNTLNWVGFWTLPLFPYIEAIYRNCTCPYLVEIIISSLFYDT